MKASYSQQRNILLQQLLQFYILVHVAKNTPCKVIDYMAR